MICPTHIAQSGTLTIPREAGRFVVSLTHTAVSSWSAVWLEATTPYGGGHCLGGEGSGKRRAGREERGSPPPKPIRVSNQANSSVSCVRFGVAADDPLSLMALITATSLIDGIPPFSLDRGPGSRRKLPGWTVVSRIWIVLGWPRVPFPVQAYGSEAEARAIFGSPVQACVADCPEQFFLLTSFGRGECPGAGSDWRRRVSAII